MNDIHPRRLNGPEPNRLGSRGAIGFWHRQGEGMATAVREATRAVPNGHDQINPGNALRLGKYSSNGSWKWVKQ